MAIASHALVNVLRRTRARPISLPAPALTRSLATAPRHELRVIPADVRDGFAGSVGNTPLIRLRKLSEETGCEVRTRTDCGQYAVCGMPHRRLTVTSAGMII